MINQFQQALAGVMIVDMGLEMTGQILDTGGHQRNLDFLTDVVKKIWKTFRGAERYVQEMYPQLKDPRYPDLPRKEREK